MILYRLLFVAVLFLLFCSTHYVYAWPVPDTGQTKCYDDTDEIPCPSPGEDFYGQDANYNTNPPQYIKLDATGKYLSDSAISWSMIMDKVTGLIWEIKTTDSSIHDRSNKFDWYDAQDFFIETLNSNSFGGYSDWRLPKAMELSTIINADEWDSAVNTSYFPQTVNSNYWSSDSSTESHAWKVYFYNGTVRTRGKSELTFARAVRGNQFSTGVFVDNEDGTITDIQTGLMWQQTTSEAMPWEDAIDYCEGSNLANYSDWRLPNKNELQSIINNNVASPVIDIDFFPDTKSAPYWTSTSVAEISTSAWLINFDTGNIGGGIEKTNNAYAKAVRSCQDSSSESIIISPPLQGSAWPIGWPMSICWKTDGLGSRVKISLSRTGGIEESFETITESIPNNGQYNWKVIGPASINCVLKIEQANNPLKWVTEGLFTIKPCYSQEELDTAIVNERQRWDVKGDNIKGLEEAIDALQVISGVK